MADSGLGSSQFTNESLGISDNNERDGDEKLDGHGDRDEESDGDLDDEEESEDAELGEYSYIFQQLSTHL